MKAKLTFLTEDEISIIHEASFQILENTGMRIKSAKARELLYQNGAEVFGEIVKMPKGMVEKAIKEIKPNMVLGARNKQNTIIPYNLKKPVVTINGISPFTKDWRTGEVRNSTAKDLEEFAIVCDYYDEVGFFGSIVAPMDVNPLMQEIITLAISLIYNSKHIQCTTCTEKTAYWQLKIAELFLEDGDTLKDNPIFSTHIAPISPLTLGTIEAESIILMAQNGIPISPFTTPLAGSTAPVTLAGSLALGNAENLGILTLIKAANKDGHMIYSSDTCVPNAKTGIINYQSPEYNLFAMANNQLAKFYNLPSCVAHDCCEDLPYDQTSWERCRLEIMLNLMTGTDLSAWLGSKDSSLTSSLVDLIASVDLLREAYEYLEDFLINEKENGVEFIETLLEVNGDKHYDDQWQFQYMRKNQHRNSFHHDYSEKNIIEKSRIIIQDILKTHQPEPISKEVQRELNEILKHAEQDLVCNKGLR